MPKVAQPWRGRLLGGEGKAQGDLEDGRKISRSPQKCAVTLKHAFPHLWEFLVFGEVGRERAVTPNPEAVPATPCSGRLLCSGSEELGGDRFFNRPRLLPGWMSDHTLVLM